MEGNSFNPLDVILKENKLTGPNYIDWKRNLNLVLTTQEYKFMLTMCARLLQVATLRKRMSRPISYGGRQMRWLVVIYWPPCLIYYNTIMRTWPQPMIWWWTSKKYLENRIVQIGKWLWRQSSIRRWQREPQYRIMFWRWSHIWMNWRSGSRDWRRKPSRYRAHVSNWVL